jgi:hypothetical protein
LPVFMVAGGVHGGFQPFDFRCFPFSQEAPEGRVAQRESTTLTS